MAAWWQSLSALDHVLLYIAVPATLILLIQTVLLFAGGAFDSDGDAGVPDADGPDFDGPDADGGPLHEAAADPETPDTGLHLFTVRGVVAFLVLFGWGGLWLHQVGLPGFLAVFLAIPIGFAGMVEVALFADILTLKEALEFDATIHTDQDFLLTSCCCPMWIAMIRKVYAQLTPHIPGAVSPMIACGRVIKKLHPEAVTVFIGPCIAKKSEVVDQKIEGNADYVLTYSEIRAIMKAKSVALEPDENSYQESSVYGKRFANAGGVTAAVLQSMKEANADVDVKVHKANGAAECKKALLLMRAAKLPADFIEGMACEGGCVGGPSAYNDQFSSKKSRDSLISQADDRGIHENLSHYQMDSFSMHRE